MTNLSEIGGLYQSIPANLKNTRTKAFAYACDRQIAKLLECAAKAKVWCDIGQVDERYLDYLAADSRALFYDSELAPDAKRELIINSPYWYMKLGTLTALEEIVTAVFGEGKVEEWFQYGGEPYHFRIHVTNANVSSTQNRIFKEMLRGVKRLSAQLDAIDYIFQDEFVEQVDLAASLRMISAFYPRYNTPPFYLDGSALLDGTYHLNGYLSGQSLDFYPLALQVSAGAEWRTASAGAVNMQTRFCPWVWQRIGNTAELGIWGAACAQVHPENCVYLAGESRIKTGNAVQAEIQSSAVQAVEQGVSWYAVGGAEVPGASWVDALQVRGTVGEVCVASESCLIVEKDLWLLDGSELLDGSRLLDAEIYEEEI